MFALRSARRFYPVQRQERHTLSSSGALNCDCLRVSCEWNGTEARRMQDAPTARRRQRDGVEDSLRHCCCRDLRCASISFPQPGMSCRDSASFFADHDMVRRAFAKRGDEACGRIRRPTIWFVCWGSRSSAAGAYLWHTSDNRIFTNTRTV